MRQPASSPGGHVREAAPLVRVALDRDTERLLRLARKEARRVGHRYCGSEHLVLGLLRSGRGPAAQLLMARGASLKRAREQLLKMVGRGS